MSKKKVQTTNEYAFSDPYSSPDIEEFRQFRPQADPSIPHRFAAQRNRVMDAYQNPTGAYSTPELNTERQMAQLGELGQEEGQAMRESQYDVNQQRGAQLGNIAALTRPNFYQKSGTQTQSGGFWGDLAIGVASGLASNPKI